MNLAFNKLSKVLPKPDANTAIFMTVILSVSLFFANSYAYEFAASPLIPPAPSLVKQIVNLSNQAESHEDWHEQRMALEETKSLFFNDWYSNTSRCSAVKDLSPQDLLTFYDEITDSTKEPFKNCSRDLTQKLTAFMTTATQSLDSNYQRLTAKNLRPCSKEIDSTLGPVRELLLDPESAEVQYGDDYPECAITLTFDDGPHATLTQELLQILEDENLTVNFFVVGRMVKSHPEVLQEAFNRGHVIGNHTQSHLDLRKFSLERATKEIEDGFKSIIDALDIYVPFFRFPYGASTKSLRSYLKNNGQVEFYWNIDTRDWAIKNPEELFTYALRQVDAAQKGIALFHDIQPQTIAMMPYFLRALREAGYKPYLAVPIVNQKKSLN